MRALEHQEHTSAVVTEKEEEKLGTAGLYNKDAAHNCFWNRVFEVADDCIKEGSNSAVI